MYPGAIRVGRRKDCSSPKAVQRGKRIAPSGHLL
jgi:hypothetical protein